GLSFATAVNSAAGTHPASVSIGDLNNDGTPDLVVANEGTYPNYPDGNVSVLLGNGNGTFAAAVNYGAGSRPNAAAICDLNGDGKLDLAVANFGSNNVSVLMGNGDGTFHMAVNYTAGGSPDS